MSKPLVAAIAFLVAAHVGVAAGQTRPLPDPIEDLERARALLSSQQDRFGPMDARLIEPLEQLADQFMRNNQFDQAHDALDRAMQITRVQGGLYTDLQRPLLRKKIDNFANRGDWEGARENMEHLLWLYTKKSEFINRDLIEDLLALARVHLRGVAEDIGFMQGYHFQRSEQIRWMAIGAAERLWGKTDTRLVPIIYEQLRQLHLQRVALWRGGSTSYALRKVAPGSDIMQDRDEVEQTFYQTGLGLISSLYSIYAQGESPDPEAVAMTNLYLADWHILYGEAQVATEAYQQTYRELLAAEVEAALLNELFAQPTVLPDTEFYPSVEAAVAAHGARLEALGEGGDSVYLSFSEWSSALPNVRNPLSAYSENPESMDSNFALFSFSLAGVNKVSRWYSHRFVSTINMIEQAELLAQYMESPTGEQQLLAKLNSLTFRPMLVDGEPQQASGQLKYYFADGSIQPY